MNKVTYLLVIFAFLAISVRSTNLRGNDDEGKWYEKPLPDNFDFRNNQGFLQQHIELLTKELQKNGFRLISVDQMWTRGNSLKLGFGYLMTDMAFRGEVIYNAIYQQDLKIVELKRTDPFQKHELEAGIEGVWEQYLIPEDYQKNQSLEIYPLWQLLKTTLNQQGLRPLGLDKAEVFARAKWRLSFSYIFGGDMAFRGQAELTKQQNGLWQIHNMTLDHTKYFEQ